MKTAIIFVVCIGAAIIAGALIVVLREHKKIRFYIDLFTALTFGSILVKIVFFSFDQNSWLTTGGWLCVLVLAGGFCGARIANIPFFKGPIEIRPEDLNNL